MFAQRYSLAAFGVIGCLGLGAQVSAASPPIRDEARLFSATSLLQADALIHDIQNDFRENVLIETFPSAPWVARLTHDFHDSRARNRYFSEWARRNAKRAGLAGIYVLICKDPAPMQIEVVAGRDALRFFSVAECDRLRDLLLGRFQQGQFDLGLDEGLRMIQLTLEHNGAIAPAPESTFSWLPIAWTWVVLMALWGCLELVRYFAVAPAQQVNGAGGSLPAGLFVTMTKPWLADLLGPREQHVLEHSLAMKTAAVVDPQPISSFGDPHPRESTVHAPEFGNADPGHPVVEHEVSGDGQH